MPFQKPKTLTNFCLIRIDSIGDMRVEGHIRLILITTYPYMPQR